MYIKDLLESVPCVGFNTPNPLSKDTVDESYNVKVPEQLYNINAV